MARFLGYDIAVQHCDGKQTRGKRSINGVVALRMPAAFVKERSQPYLRKGKPIHRPERTQETDYSLLCQYQAEYRGYVQYYQMATNLGWLNRLHWVMQMSLLKTLAHKHKSSVAKMARKYRARVETAYGPRCCLEVQVARAGKAPLVGRFGGVPLRRQDAAEKVRIADRAVDWRTRPGTELVKRLLAEVCESCGSTQHVEVHHVRRLSDVNPKGRRAKPDWMHLMASRRRKTLVLCRVCHDNLHAGRALRRPAELTKDAN